MLLKEAKNILKENGYKIINNTKEATWVDYLNDANLDKEEFFEMIQVMADAVSPDWESKVGDPEMAIEHLTYEDCVEMFGKPEEVHNQFV